MNFNKKNNEIIERTAPSPTGGLHIGHVYSVLTAYENARQNHGLFKLRIEDIDFNRCKLDFEKEIIANLSWLGVSWNGKIMRQRNRKKYYLSAITQLMNEGLLYPCSCTRADIQKVLAAPHPNEKLNQIYPGTCRGRQPTKPIQALRLNIAKAKKIYSKQKLYFIESGHSTNYSLEDRVITMESLENQFGDVIIARSDINTSYNLAVVLDDASQKITHVTRGDDLLAVTPIQVLLQKLLSLPTPIYHHHKLLYDASGKKISKRSSNETVSSLKAEGISAEEVIHRAFSQSERIIK